MAKAYNKVVQVGVWVLSWFTYPMGRFYLILIANIFDLSHYKLYLLYLVILPQHVFITSAASVVLLWYLYFLYQFFWCSTFSLYVPCQLLYQLNLFCGSFLLYLLLRVSLLTQTNHYLAISIYIHISCFSCSAKYILYMYM